MMKFSHSLNLQYLFIRLESAAGPFKEAPLSGKCRHLLTAGSGAFPSTAAARLIIYLQPPSVLSSLWSHAVNITLFIKY